MSLERLSIIDLRHAPLPARVEDFVNAAIERIDRMAERERPLGFVPSDYTLAWHVLEWVRRTYPAIERVCEWGSGHGVVVGLAALAGYEACGIEIQPRLVASSRELLAEFALEATIMEGSFLPDDYEEPPELLGSDWVTDLGGAGAQDEVDVDPDDFDLIYAFPWPGEEALYFDLFERRAAYNALFLSYHGVDGMHLYRRGK